MLHAACSRIRAWQDPGIDPDLLELELTERMVMAGGEASTALLQRIQQRGMLLSLDDFGTGYCSLSYLKHFPIDALKIDCMFVRDVINDAGGAQLQGFLCGSPMPASELESLLIAATAKG